MTTILVDAQTNVFVATRLLVRYCVRMTTGERLRELRERHAISQDQLGKEVGCSQGTVWNLERGAHPPNLEVGFGIERWSTGLGEPIFAREWLADPEPSCSNIAKAS